ncbi:MAG: zf-TFIIB domain-containing protein [Eggerthellaceae bacterium]|nr:zf-TFIIB domain-containing protein [Eggerthellaceae bacterium]
MKCPICSVDLVMSERQGIEIDYCPQCRGVWLDRGELDKIIERSASASFARDDRRERDYDRDYDGDRERKYDREHDRKRDRDYDKRYDDYKKKKKKHPASFLGDLFEFGD